MSKKESWQEVKNRLKQKPEEEKITLTVQEYEQLKQEAEAKKTISISVEEYNQLKSGKTQHSGGIGLSDNDVRRISGMKGQSNEKEYADFMFKAGGHMLGKIIKTAVIVFIGILLFGAIGKIFLGT